MSAEIPQTAEGVTYDMIRERDHYRSRCQAAVERIERESGRLTDVDGFVVGRMLPIEVWRSIRAMLQQEPLPESGRS